MKSKEEIEFQIFELKRSIAKNEFALNKMAFEDRLYPTLAGATEIFKQRVLILEWVLLD